MWLLTANLTLGKESELPSGGLFGKTAKKRPFVDQFGWFLALNWFFWPIFFNKKRTLRPKSYPKLLQSSFKVTKALLTIISFVCANPICRGTKSDSVGAGVTDQIWLTRYSDSAVVGAKTQPSVSLKTDSWRLKEKVSTTLGKPPSLECWYTAVLWNHCHCTSSTPNNPHSQPSSVYNFCCP